jgi:hypothetical protein
MRLYLRLNESPCAPGTDDEAASGVSHDPRCRGVGHAPLAKSR